MVRKRWKNRSDEDKQRIHDEQKAQSKGKAGQRSSDYASEIYVKGKIPIMCPKCLLWSDSDNYVLVKEIPPFGGTKVNMLHGTCSRCQSNMSRIFPPLFLSESFAFVNTLVRLKNEGKLEDRR